jgi:hypothetical protein
MNLLSPEINYERIIAPTKGRRKNHPIDFANCIRNAENPASFDFAYTSVVRMIMSIYERSCRAFDLLDSFPFEKD